jgi:hypothetical protein
MTQKIIENDKSISDVLQTIEPKGIADESMRHTVEILQQANRAITIKSRRLRVRESTVKRRK